MALTTDKMLSALANGTRALIYKASVTNVSSGYLASLWRASGGLQWPQGAIPAGASTPTDATTGAILLPTFGAGTTGRIYKFAPIGNTIGNFLVYDRIAHMGGLSGTTLTAQTVSLDVATAITNGRCLADYSCVEWYVEIYTDIGTTGANLTVTYTDKNDAPGKTVVLTGFSGASPLNRSGRCVRLITTDGIPIKSIQSCIWSGTTGTAGSFGFTARTFKCQVSQMVANIMGVGTDGISLGLPKVEDDVCLEMLVMCSTTSTGIIMGDIIIGNVDEA
jgi:hypothetical protein